MNKSRPFFNVVSTINETAPAMTLNGSANLKKFAFPNRNLPSSRMTQAYWTRDRVAEEFEIETRVLPWIGGSKAYTAAKSWWCTYDLLIRKDDWTPDFILAWALKQESEVGGVLAKNLHQAVPQIFEYVGPKMQ